MEVKGLVELEHICGKTGKKTITKQENNFLMHGEDFMARFFSKMFTNKYDDNEGASQVGYFDFIAVGTGFKTPIDGSDTVIVLPNKPIGILDEQLDVYDGRTVRIHSGTNAGINGEVAENGYNPANESFGGNPTITLASALDNPVLANVQFTINSTVEEKGLQGEGRADFKGVSFLHKNNYRVPVIKKEILSDSSFPVGEANEIYISAELPQAALSGGDSVLITEMALVNTIAVPSTPDIASGEYQARVLITPTEKAPDDIINLRWRMRFGLPRTLSI